MLFTWNVNVLYPSPATRGREWTVISMSELPLHRPAGQPPPHLHSSTLSQSRLGLQALSMKRNSWMKHLATVIPSGQLWTETGDMWGGPLEAKIGCLVSLGMGKPTLGDCGPGVGDLGQKLLDVAIETQKQPSNFTTITGLTSSESCVVIGSKSNKVWQKWV